MRKPWVIAHRGASGHAPENTMAAFERAVALGAGFIETDLHLTRDARFVAIHDPTLERTTNGTGLVKDLTLAEIRKLDAGHWFDREFMGQKVPTLEEIVGIRREARRDFLSRTEIRSGLGHAPFADGRAAKIRRGAAQHHYFVQRRCFNGAAAGGSFGDDGFDF